MKSNSAIVAALVLLVLAGIGYTGYQFVEHKESGYCSACQRTIHEHTRTVAMTGGKRLFRCAPIHHHFHLGGWTEQQIVVRFWLLTAIFAALALATIRIR